MRNLVWKDIVVAKWFLAAAIPVYIGQLVSMAGIAPMYALLTLFGAGFFAIISVGIEEAQRTEALWNSLPVNRDRIVYGRYLTTALGILFALIVSWLVLASLAAWFPVDDEGTTRALGPGTYLSFGCMLLLTAALYLPCYFRFGAGTGLQVFSALSVGLLVLLSVSGTLIVLANGGPEALARLRSPSAEQVAGIAQWLEARQGGLLAGLAVTTLAITIWSATLSAQFYRVRDL